MSSYQIIRKSEQLTTVWAGGTTIQLAIQPTDASLAARNFAWRLSTATVTQAGEFSQFRGYGRWLGLRQGAGLNLTVGQQQMQLKAPQHMLWFSGDAKTSAELIAGDVVDINLILAAGWQGGMQAVALPSNQSLVLKVPEIAHEFLLYVDEGQLWLTISEQIIMLDTGDVLRCSCAFAAENLTKALLITAQTQPSSAVVAWVAPEPKAM